MALQVRTAQTDAELESARALRLEVFVREQGVPEELELDSLDTEAVHAVALDGDEVVGTGRLVQLSSGSGLIGRMAVGSAFRRRGIGSRLLACLETEAQSLGIQHITLHAQTYVRPFYQLAGYIEIGTTFQEAGIEHIRMDKQI